MAVIHRVALLLTYHDLIGRQLFMRQEQTDVYQTLSHGMGLVHEAKDGHSTMLPY